MNEADALWAACLANPADDTARQVFADKLQENGFVALAEAVRGSVGSILVRAARGPNVDDAVLRLYGMFADHRDEELREIVDEHIDELIDSEAVADATAETNAYGWGVNGFDIEATRFTGRGCHVQIEFWGSGDQNPDAAYSGHEMRGTAEIVIDAAGRVECEVLSAAVDQDEGDDDGDLEDSEPDE